MKRGAAIDWVVLAFLVAWWGSSFAVLKIATTHFSPMWNTAIRILVAIPVLFAVLAARGQPLPPLRDPVWRAYALVGLTGMAVPFALYGFSAQRLPSAVNAICNGASPIFTGVLGHAFLCWARNGMPPMHHRSPGPLPVALADERVTLEAIADGEHVAPEVLALLLQAAPGRVALISDAMAAAGMPDGAYRIGSLDVRVEQGLPRLADGGSIAGSTLTLDRAIRMLVAAGVALEAAVDAATRAPADAVGRGDLGALAVGARADLVALDDALEVTGVWREGVRV